MTRGSKSSFLVILFALSLGGSAIAQQSALAESSRKRPAEPNLYVGTETCVTCHEEIGQIYGKSPHRKTEAGKNGPAFSGCEGCHGAGKAHAEGGGDTNTIVSFKNLSRAESTRICLDCHQQNEHRQNFLQSQHARHDVGCLDCHSSHKARSETRLLKMSQPQLCFGCHQQANPDASKPSRAAKSAVPKSHTEFASGQPCTSCHSAIHGSNSDRAPSGD